MDRCPNCKGTGEVRGAWAVTHWKMVPCDRCEHGYVPTIPVEDIVFDAVGAAITRRGEVEVSEITQEIINELIDRGIFILRERDLEEIRYETTQQVVAGYEEAHKLAERAVELAAEQAGDYEERRRLTEVLIAQADAREKLVPGSPIADDLRKVAGMIEPEEPDEDPAS